MREIFAEKNNQERKRKSLLLAMGECVLVLHRMCGLLCAANVFVSVPMYLYVGYN